MAFQGDLSNINLASVFQNLLHNRQTGTLVLRRGDEERYVYFRQGSVTMYSPGADKATPLEQLLLSGNVLSEDELSAARKKRRGRAALSQVISRLELAPEEQVRNVVREYLQDRLSDLFTWDQGTFEFRQGEPVEGVFDREMALADLKLDANEVILEAARRVDEWDRINRHIGSSKDIYVPRKEREKDLEAGEDVNVAAVVSLLDGRRSVQRVAEESGLGRYRTMKILSDLVQARMLRQLSVAELHVEARRAVEEKRLTEAQALLERALEIEHGNVEAHLLLADIKEKTGKSEEAASSYKVAAGLFLEDGEAKKAAEALKHAIRNQPHDISARERLYHLLKDARRHTEARELLLESASYCTKMGLAERAKAMLEDGLTFACDDEDLLRMLADVYVESGESTKAADLFHRRAEQALEGADYPRALKWYEEVLKIRPGDDTARRRIVEITSGAMERRRRRNRIIFRTAIAALVLAGVGFFAVLECDARLASGPMLDSLVTAVLSKEAAAPRKVLLDFQNAHPHTRAAEEARRMLRVIDAYQALSLLDKAEALEAAGKKKEAAAFYKRLKTMDLPADFLMNVDARLSNLPTGGE